MFQSTPPARAATEMLTLLGRLRKFQSTPPARAATPHAGDCARGRMFQSTPPARAATVPIWRNPPEGLVSIHAAREGGDFPSLNIGAARTVFQSTPPARAATGFAAP